MEALFGLGATAEIEVVFTDEESKTIVDVKADKDHRAKFPLYFDGESVSGKVDTIFRPFLLWHIDTHIVCNEAVIQLFKLKLAMGKDWNTRIRIEFVGQIQLFYDRGNHYEFLSLSQELTAPGEFRHSATFDFDFKNVEKAFESYHGLNVKLRLSDVVKEREIWAYSYRMPPEINNSIKMEVGIEDCLHIEFSITNQMRIKIKNMELSIIRRESTGVAPNQYNESETITKFEIMDGAPVRVGETIPIRLFLSGFELTPTYRDVNKKFSVRYYLNLVLIDEENRRYFKQQEMILFTDFGAFVLFILTLLDMCCKSIDDSEEHKEIAGGATMAALSTYKGAQGKVWCSFGEMLQDIHAMLFDGVCDQAKSAYGE
ncbi:hypothetical protein BSLG_010038 [Batrachochytrium salamandrivorans]|nr:hypothetical protein BSLG_010038 [Batrachochytrium salamandrivorans]